MITIHDVAKRAGVSISTVSNVLNKNKYVSDDLVRRVNAAVQELEYTANPIAQKMKFKHTKTIGVIMADICGLFFPYLIKGMYDVLNSKGYRLIMMDSEGIQDEGDTLKRFREGIFKLNQSRVDGIIFASGTDIGGEAQTVKEVLGIPNQWKRPAFVCMEKDMSSFGVDSVFSDSRAGARTAVSHLIDRGCRRIGHITGPFFFSVAQDRIEGYKDAMKDARLPVDPHLMIVRGDYSHKTGYQGAGAAPS